MRHGKLLRSKIFLLHGFVALVGPVCSVFPLGYAWKVGETWWRPSESVDQWFSTFSLNGDESRLTSLLEGRAEAFTTSQFTRFVLLQNEACYTKS